MSNISSLLRAARTGKGLTQAALAARSGTSRITVARLEGTAGRDLRVATLARLCGALDLELTALPPRARVTLETRLAREQERCRRLGRRLRHAEVAVRLLGDPAAGRDLVQKARATVDRWERDRLCSRHYIDRWRALLAGSPARVARGLLDHTAWSDALLQNSPWAFALVPAEE
jgi:transcriptional regulator with XRE-family HTH domain